MKELIFRFLFGGTLVSVFALIGDLLRPKSFAGLFGAAPSIALASLALTIATEGKDYAALEARSMIAGVIAFFLLCINREQSYDALQAAGFGCDFGTHTRVVRYRLRAVVCVGAIGSLMRIELDLSSMHRSRWSDYALRFAFGGIVTAVTGLIANRYGPGVAGLFLAFPAIFPAGATLIEKDEIEKKRKAGLNGTARGRAAASIDAAGAAMGTLGLIAFAILVWRFLPGHSSLIVLPAAGLAWFAISMLAWRIRKAV